MPETGEELFGPGNTWGDVQAYVLRFTRRTWPGATTEEVEDAVSYAILRTLEMWVNWKSSVVPDDPTMTFNGAKRHGCMAAHKALKRSIYEGHDTMPNINEGVYGRAQLHRARIVVDALADDEREWDTWARGIITGESERQESKRTGVARTTIQCRRNSAMKKHGPAIKRYVLGTEDE